MMRRLLARLSPSPCPAARLRRHRSRARSGRWSGKMSSRAPPARCRARPTGASTSAPTGATRSSSTTPTAPTNASLDGNGQPRASSRGGSRSRDSRTPRRASPPKGKREFRYGRVRGAHQAAGRAGDLAGLLDARRRHPTRSDGRRPARSTSWSTAGRSRAWCSAACTVPGYSGGTRDHAALRTAAGALR